MQRKQQREWQTKRNAKKHTNLIILFPKEHTHTYTQTLKKKTQEMKHIKSLEWIAQGFPISITQGGRCSLRIVRHHHLWAWRPSFLLSHLASAPLAETRDDPDDWLRLVRSKKANHSRSLLLVLLLLLVSSHMALHFIDCE